MRKRRSFKGWRLQDYVDFYESNYAGMSRSEVKKVDSGFYTKVRKEGFVDEVLPERKLKDFTGWKLQDYKDYMNDNYAEMSRSEVQEADKSFYGKIRREGFADEVLPESKRRSFKGWTVEDFQKFCNDNYSGMSKSEVEKADGGFYNIIRKEGFIDEVLPESKRRDFTGWELKDYVDFYESNYAGMSRSEVNKADGGFYNKIRKEGFIDEVLPKNKKRSFKGWELQDFKDYMNNNYSGMSRKEVQKADSGFYEKVRKEGFIDEVFPKSKFGYYRDINNVQKELELIIEKLDGKFPRVKDIKKISTGLLTGIYDYHGSLTTVKIQLGYADKEMEVLKEILEELGDE